MTSPGKIPTQQILERVKYSARAALSHRGLDDAADKDVLLRDGVLGLMLEVQRDVYRQKLLEDEHTYTVPVQVQWSTAVGVTLPRTRWQRLLRRPAKTIYKSVNGRTTGYGEVVVRAEYFAHFPALNVYPSEFGSPIMWSDYRLDESIWVRGQTVATPGVNERYDPPQPERRPVKVTIPFDEPSREWVIDLNKLHLPIGNYHHSIIELDHELYDGPQTYSFTWDNPTQLTIGPFAYPHTGKVLIRG